MQPGSSPLATLVFMHLNFLRSNVHLKTYLFSWNANANFYRSSTCIVLDERYYTLHNTLFIACMDVTAYYVLFFFGILILLRVHTASLTILIHRICLRAKFIQCAECGGCEKSKNHLLTNKLQKKNISKSNSNFLIKQREREK